MLTKEGISTAFLAMNAPRLAIAGGTTRKPAEPKSKDGPNLDETLS